MSIESVTTALLISPVSFAVTADALSNPDDVAAIARAVLEALQGGQGFLAACLALVLFVAMLRRHGAKRWPVLRTDAAGTLLTFVGALAVTLGTAAAAGSLFTWTLLGTAASAAVTAAGGYTILARVGLPVIQALVVRYPRLAPLDRALRWLLDRSVRPA